MAKIDMLLHGFSLATDQGSVAFCGVTLIQGTKNILVDVAHFGRRGLLLEKLKQRGLTPDDIDYVFLTHAHYDHMLNVDAFPNSKILIHEVEREYIKAPRESDFATPRYATTVLESLQLQSVREGEEIDDGVTVLALPGHSKGSSALLVRADGVTSAITGDAVANGWSVTTGLPRIAFWDVEEAKRSIRKVLDSAQAFYPGHDRPFRVLDGNKVAYLEPTSIRVFGWPEGGSEEGGPGFTYAAEAPAQPMVFGSAQ